MISFVDPEDRESYEVEMPPVSFEVTDNPVVGELLGPNGETLARICERPFVPFGYRRPA